MMSKYRGFKGLHIWHVYTLRSSYIRRTGLASLHNNFVYNISSYDMAFECSVIVEGEEQSLKLALRQSWV